MAIIKGQYNYVSEDIKGTSGDDIFLAGSGDYVDGGIGADTVLFYDSKNNFSYSTLSGVTQIQDLNSFISEKITLTNIEKIEFSDGTVNLNPVNVSIIKGQYNYVSEDIKGTSGNDIFLAGSGDYVDGSSGTDIVLFFAPKNNFSYVTLAGTTQVKDLKSFINESISLTNVEQIQFTDGVVNLGVIVPSIDFSLPIVINHAPTGSVTISGNFIVGETLTAKNNIQDADGLGDINYYWYVGGDSRIDRSDQLVLTKNDIGKEVTVVALYHDGAENIETVKNLITNIVKDSALPAYVSPPITPTVTLATSSIIKGTSSDDFLTGTDSDNKILGLAGNDTLTGGLGNDTLNGGAGKDLLVGGKGADIFAFNIDSKNTRDTVSDLSHQEKDKIDLSIIDADTAKTGNQAFTKLDIGAKFSGKFTATGQLFFDTTTQILWGNVDTKVSADFSIQLNGVSSLVIGDFVL